MAPNINKLLKAEPRSSKYGAPMGAADRFDNVEELLYLQRIRFVDGDYAADGTYWGRIPGGPDLWCAFSEMNRIYMRATDRKHAIYLIQDAYPGVQFHKS